MNSPQYSIGNNENVVTFFCSNLRIQVQTNSYFTKVKTENFICVYTHRHTHTCKYFLILLCYIAFSSKFETFCLSGLLLNTGSKQLEIIPANP